MLNEEAIAFTIRQLFSDGKFHSSSEVANLLGREYGLSRGQAMRRLAKLVMTEEITKDRRSWYCQSKVATVDKELYKTFKDIMKVLNSSAVASAEVTAFSEFYQPALCELIYIWSSVKEIISALESGEGDVNEQEMCCVE